MPCFGRRYAVVRSRSCRRASARLPVVRAAPGAAPRRARTVVYLHGGGFVAPIDPFHVRYATRLAAALGARVVMPDYPLAPEHTWRDSHDAARRRWSRGCCRTAGGVVLAGDSAGGGLALAVALTLRDRGGPQPSHLLLISPVGRPDHQHARRPSRSRDRPVAVHRQDAGVRRVVGGLARRTWAGPRSPPALGDLAGLPPALMFFGTRDSLAPGGRLLARRAAEAGWDLTSVEEPGLIHVYPILPFLPEAGRAWRQPTLEFLR